jgi:poly(3-hydroxybutyrate) depolymerase
MFMHGSSTINKEHSIMQFSLSTSIPSRVFRPLPCAGRLCLWLAAGILLTACAAGNKTTPQAEAGTAQIESRAGQVAAGTTAPMARAAAMTSLPQGWAKDVSTFPNHPMWTFMPANTMPNGKHALMVVLHGCNQTFDQFKQFGNLEDAAAKRGIVLAIPDVGSQHFGNDIQRCWDYDQAKDNHNNMNDVIKIADTLADNNGGNNIDRGHIYIVGLSSGGAMALDIACKRPDLFAGVGSIAGPSVGSMQPLAINGPLELPQITLPPGVPPIPMLLNNVVNAANMCKTLAANTGNASQFETQIASIAVGDMDKGSASHNDRFPFQLRIGQPECDHAGQVALIPQKWSRDNIEAFRGIYGADRLGTEVSVQGGLAAKQAAMKNGKERISFVTIKNVGHAWPAGKGSGTCVATDNPDNQGSGVWIAQKGLDYPEFITNWLMTNNARAGNPFTHASIAPDGAATASRNTGK